VTRLWYVRTEEGALGPFPAGAIVADRLVGRIPDDRELSPDRQDWRVFDAWPELVSLAHGSNTPSDAQPDWAAEGGQARLRWIDQRSHADRRVSTDATATERRHSRAERRLAQRDTDNHRSRRRSPMRVIVEPAVMKLLAVLVVSAALVALLVYLYGPVNPVPVRIR